MSLSEFQRLQKLTFNRNRPRSPRSRKGSIGKGKSPISTISLRNNLTLILDQNVVADVPTQLPKLVLETIEKECLVTVHGPDNDGYNWLHKFPYLQ